MRGIPYGRRFYLYPDVTAKIIHLGVWVSKIDTTKRQDADNDNGVIFCMDSVISNVVTDVDHRTLQSAPQFISTDLVCLNFKVPMRVRQQFKIYAARHNVTMTDLLLRLIDGLYEPTTPLTNNEIKK
jgi:hypothetical protein